MRITLFHKLIAFTAAAATFFGATAAVSAGGLTPSFNNMTNDAEFLVGKNLTQNQDTFTDPVSGKAGDQIDVAVYYHNTVPGSVAENTRIRVQLPTGYNTTNVVRATLSADDVTSVTGTVVNGVEKGNPNLSILSQQSTNVQFVAGSVRWYPDGKDVLPENRRILPNGQSGDSIVTSGINLGDIAGCWQYSGYVIFTVKLVGQVIETPKANLLLTKEVRRAGSTEAFRAENQVNPGERVEYRITVRNNDGQGIASNVKLTDTLEQGLTYVPGTTKKQVNGTTTALPDGITTTGIVIADSMAPLTTVTVTFEATTDSTLANTVCRKNVVRVTASNATLPGDATANTCFVVPTPSPTPTPTATPTATPVPTPPVAKPTPKPELPQTGGDIATLASILGVSLAAGGATARQLMQRRALKKQSRNVTII